MKSVKRNGKPFRDAMAKLEMGEYHYSCNAIAELGDKDLQRTEARKFYSSVFEWTLSSTLEGRIYSDHHWCEPYQKDRDALYEIRLHMLALGMVLWEEGFTIEDFNSPLEESERL